MSDNKKTVIDGLLSALLERKFVRPLDVHFARWLALKIPDSSERQLMLAALLSQQLAEGHVCIALDRLDQVLASWPAILAEPARALLFNGPLDANALLDNKLIGDGATLTPLVLARGRLYLYRYWQYEVVVARYLLCQAGAEQAPIDEQWLRERLDVYFGCADVPDWQRIAAAVSVRQSVSVISGGPGTGKTTTVTKLLAIYIERQLLSGRRPQIQLAAPTGKAAARLSESIAQAKERLTLSPDVTALIPEQGQTLHRLLGSRRNTRRFIHDADNPLPVDLLVIDEASMIDLPMMASIVQALSAQTRLVLIGDRDQLASVEAGSVLGDICAAPEFGCYSQHQSQQLALSCQYHSTGYTQQRFADNLAFLRKSYRFREDSGIGALAAACNSGRTEDVVRVMAANHSDLELLSVQHHAHMLEQLEQGYNEYFSLIDSAVSAQALLSAFARFQILCALRIGPFGAQQINEDIEQRFKSRTGQDKQQRWYVGRPIMVTRNDSQMNLYNGDIGIAAIEPSSGQLKVWFEQAGGLRAVLPSRLPQHETVFA
ncbi:MAG: exodeoxyribonuclease V subunit alpha, partial [Pseudomonadales bacterium]